MPRTVIAQLCLIAAFLFSAVAPAVDAGTLALRPGEIFPQPGQRGLNEIETLPQREAPCPVCGFSVAIPLVDALMRRPPTLAADAPLPWRMHAASRDADLCPYPGPGKVAFQADIVLCPSCGYAQKQTRWADPASAEAKAWVMTNLRPSLREAQKNLLGRRAGELSDAQISEFFNQQSEIPDIVRTEHYRIFLEALHAPARDRAEACWLAAWAARRETASPPRNALLAAPGAAAAAETERARTKTSGLQGRADALRAFLRKSRQDKTALPGAKNLAARALLAGMLDRLGHLEQSEEMLREIARECRERFLRTDQDPLWSETNPRAPRTHRLEELETLRSDAEREMLARVELVRRERVLLQNATQRIREALRAGELDGNPEEALFFSYLAGEFLRRSGNLPLASEWFKNLLALTEPESPLGLAAASQLRAVGEEAGDKVNLLSALGQDGDLFEKLRDILAEGK